MTVADDLNQLGKNQANLQKNFLTLKKRLDKLEARFDEYTGETPDEDVEETTADDKKKKVVTNAVADFKSRETSKPIENLGFKIFGAVGFGLILLGLIFLYKYAVDTKLLGYGGRIVIGVLFSLAFIVAGEIFGRKQYEKFSQLLTGGGLGLLYFTFFASYAFIGPREALGITAPMIYTILFIVLIAAIILGLRANSMLLTAYAFVLGYAAPLLIGAARGSMNIHEVMIPTLLLSAGLAYILRSRPTWRLSVFGALVSFSIYLIVFSERRVIRFSTANGIVPEIIGPAFLYLVLIAVLWSVLALFLPDDEKNTQNVVIAILSAVALTGFGLAMVWRYWNTYNGAFLILLAAAYLGMTFMARERNLRIMFETFFIICVALVTIAIPVQLEKYWIAFAWAVEGLLLVRSGVKIEVRGLRIIGYAALGLAVINTLVWGSQLDTAERLLSYLATIIGLFAGAYFLSKDPEKSEQKTIMMGVLALVGTLVLTVLFAVEIWDYNGLFAGVSSNVRHVTLSIVWALEAIACIVFGFIGRSKVYRTVGALLFGVVVLKILIIDLGALDNSLLRTLVTIVVGLIALGGAFAYIKNKDSIEAYLKEK